MLCCRSCCLFLSLSPLPAALSSLVVCQNRCSVSFAALLQICEEYCTKDDIWRILTTKQLPSYLTDACRQRRFSHLAVRTRTVSHHFTDNSKGSRDAIEDFSFSTDTQDDEEYDCEPNKRRKLRYSPSAWLSCFHLLGSWPVAQRNSAWTSWFCQYLGVPIPQLLLLARHRHVR